jgi:hypothetical protein
VTDVYVPGPDNPLGINADDSSMLRLWLAAADKSTVRLGPILFRARVDSYFDAGYVERFGGTAAQNAARIDGHVRVVVERYWELFGLQINRNQPVQIESPLDRCKRNLHSQGADLDAQCPLGIPANRCTYSGRLSTLFRLDFPGTPIRTTALWSGHRTNLTVGVWDIEDHRSFSHYDSIFMLERDNLVQENRSTLFHELNHQFGAPDHYHELLIPGNENSCRNREFCNVCNPGNGRQGWCIMSRSNRNILLEFIICDPCQIDIRNHLEDHHK